MKQRLALDPFEAVALAILRVAISDQRKAMADVMSGKSEIFGVCSQCRKICAGSVIGDEVVFDCGKHKS